MKDTAIRITLARHGESEANRVQRWQGQGDSPLSERGRAQAMQLGQRLASVRFDRVLSSDLSRARETARATGHEFEVDPAWREFDVGVWEGLSREEVSERFPEEMERLKAGEDIPMGGGESYRTFSERIDRALAGLRAEFEPGSHVLIVCHGGVIGTLLAGLLGLRGGNRWPLGRATNTSLSHVRMDGARGELCVYNDASHLWPGLAAAHPIDDEACVALLADADPHTVQGEFAARYEGRPLGSQQHLAFSSLHGSEPLGRRAALLARALSEVRADHSGQRIAVALEGELIRALIEDTLWLGGGRQGALSGPRAGSITHVAVTEGRAALLDYAATPEFP